MTSDSWNAERGECQKPDSCLELLAADLSVYLLHRLAAVIANAEYCAVIIELLSVIVCKKSLSSNLVIMARLFC